MGDYYCTNCYADLEDQPGFDPSEGIWTCTECGKLLTGDDFPSGDRFEDVVWFCDNCNAILNKQYGFSDTDDTWTCTECGYMNSITEDDIWEDEHKCPCCGANLKKQADYNEYDNDYTCDECDSVLHRDYSGEEFSVVDDRDLCPNCNAYLKNQCGYSDCDYDWTCSECDAELHREYTSDQYSVVEGKNLCPNCGANLKNQEEYDEEDTEYTCDECKTVLHRDYSSDEFSVDDETAQGICPNCKADLNEQYDYDEYDDDDWTCTACGAELHRDNCDEPYSVVEEENLCPCCGANLYKQSGYSEYSYDWTCCKCDTELHRDDFDEEFDIVEEEESDNIDSTSRKHYFYSSDETTHQNVSSKTSTKNNASNNESKVENDSHPLRLLSKREVRKKRAKAFLLKKKKITLGYSSSELEGKRADEVYAILHNSGFKYIKSVELNDVYVDTPFSENEVEKVDINWQSKFEKNCEFPYDSNVIISIHKKREIVIPFSASSVKNVDHEKVCARLDALGFTEIYTYPIKDLVTGWITKNGSVDRIVINGINKFKKGSVFKFDAKIIICYHTFKKKSV